MDKQQLKIEFLLNLQNFALQLKNYVSTPDNQWTIKGFIDVFENIYTISNDTKIISKIMEIHLFSHFLTFAEQHGFNLIWAEKQNWYPDISFVSQADATIKFAVDLKTTYRIDGKPEFCNGFTLGSHGEYFVNQNSTKNIQFPYNQYLGHYVLGVLYSRKGYSYLEEATIYQRSDLENIASVMSDFEFFAQEKWRIASDKSGSGNTANIGSINYIADILQGNGSFARLGEEWFNEYWQNFGKITFNNKKITDLTSYLSFKGKNPDWIAQHSVGKHTTSKSRKHE